MSSSISEVNSSIFVDIQKLHEVPVPTNQEPSQSEIPTSGYSQNIEGIAMMADAVSGLASVGTTYPDDTLLRSMM